jgi:uncharacterized membrane protein YbhN (UPF0104 family)
MTTRQKWRSFAKIVFLVLLSYFCLRVLISHSVQLSDRLGTLSLAWIIAAALFTSGYYVLGLLSWRLILRSLGSQPDFHMTARAYVYALLAKYIPGSVMAHGVRAQLAIRAGVPALILMKSFLFEAVFALGTAAAISIPGTLYFVPAVVDHLSIGVVALVALILAGIAATRRFKLIRTSELQLAATHRRSSGYVNVFSIFLLVWFVFGAAHWCLANALGVYGISKLPELIVAASASWALGFVSIFAPAGLGVREAVLYFFVHNWMAQADVILFLTASRLLMFSVEVLLTVGFVLYSKFADRN